MILILAPLAIHATSRGRNNGGASADWSGYEVERQDRLNSGAFDGWPCYVLGEIGF